MTSFFEFRLEDPVSRPGQRMTADSLSPFAAVHPAPAGAGQRRATGRWVCPGAGLAVLLVVWLTGCSTPSARVTQLEPFPRPTVPEPSAAPGRSGQEIVVAGRLFPVGTRVVLWSDPGGYDAYNPGPHFVSSIGGKGERPPFRRYDARHRELELRDGEPPPTSPLALARVRDLIDQFVIHYDACGTSRRCFEVLHDQRGLSCHFLLDLDGTIHQTLDLREKAWHATVANTRSIGIEIAHVGAYPPNTPSPLNTWYVADRDGAVRLQLPPMLGDPGFDPDRFVLRPARPTRIQGSIQDRELEQYDFTPEQYAALTRLTAALCAIFPKLRCDYPRDPDGQLIRRALPPGVLAGYSGLLGHYHVQTDKIDPGPAFQWDRVVDGARRLLPELSLPFAGHLLVHR